MWDKPGSWTSLKKNNGAYTTNTTSAARLVTPVIGADQYVEITYDQDPGAASWVGVMTRVQGPANGSGYLAIAYAGEVRLYRTDDTGALNFTLLASASARWGQRRGSCGWNRKERPTGCISTASGIGYTANETVHDGAAGDSGSVFGGPTVKILSFAGERLREGATRYRRYEGRTTERGAGSGNDADELEPDHG